MNTLSAIKNIRPQVHAAQISSSARMLLAATLPACLALVPGHALAVPASGGNETNVNQVVATVGPATWTTLRAVPIMVVNTPRFCAVTGSSDALNPGGVSNFYRFNLTLAAGADPIDSGRERTLHFFNQPIAGGQVVFDNRIKEITSTWWFQITTPGVNFVRWRATKFAAATANLTVDDSSISVVCTDVALPN